jgi:FkbM family methyltransferase
MNRFSELKDRHFPNGYSDEIIESINTNVQWFIDIIYENFNIDNLVIFDIGSLNGIESFLFSQKIKNSKIYTFEPSPESYLTVEKCTDGIENIKINQLAVSNYNGKSNFFMTHDNQGASSLLKPNRNWSFGFNINQVEVDVIRLDDWCHNNNIKIIDVLWIDAQGSEMNIFLGMEKLLNNVKAIHVECSTIPYYEGGYNKNDIIKYLESFDLHLVNESPHNEVEGDLTFLKGSVEISKGLRLQNNKFVEYKK